MSCICPYQKIETVKNYLLKYISIAFPKLSLNKIKRVINDTYVSIIEGKNYNGERKVQFVKGAYIIPRYSVYERIVCDLIETELNISHTTVLVNVELNRYEKIEVRICYICDTYQ